MVNALQLAALFGAVFGVCMYRALRVIITYDRQKGLGEVAQRRSIYFAVAVGLLIGALTFVLAR